MRASYLNMLKVIWSVLYMRFIKLHPKPVHCIHWLLHLLIVEKLLQFWKNMKVSSTQVWNQELTFASKFIWHILIYIFPDLTKDKNGHLDRANNKSEKFTGFAIKYFSPMIMTSLLEMAVISVIYSYVTQGFINVQYLFIPYKFV